MRFSIGQLDPTPVGRRFGIPPHAREASCGHPITPDLRCTWSAQPGFHPDQHVAGDGLKILAVSPISVRVTRAMTGVALSHDILALGQRLSELVESFSRLSAAVMALTDDEDSS